MYLCIRNSPQFPPVLLLVVLYVKEYMFGGGGVKTFCLHSADRKSLFIINYNKKKQGNSGVIGGGSREAPAPLILLEGQYSRFNFLKYCKSVLFLSQYFKWNCYFGLFS